MARNQEQNEKMKDERRNQIRSAALRQFAAKGLFATKIKDIADDVGMSQGLIYHYYPSKADIYVALIEDALDKMNEAVLLLKAMDIPAGEKIRLSIKELLKTIKESDEFNETCRFIAQAGNSNDISEQAKAIIAQKRDLPYHVIAKIMAEGQKDGAIIAGAPEDLAVLFWTSINGLAIYRASRQEPTQVPDASILIHMFLREENNGTKNSALS